MPQAAIPPVKRSTRRAIVKLLKTEGALDSGQLARRLNMRANTVTTIVNALSSRGMLERVTADDDRRAVKLTVTEAGQQAVLSWQATNAAVLHLALSTLPAKQRRALAAAAPALDALARAIDQLADRPAAAQDQDAD